ncbi:hypothetical protein [Thermococcus piezophilus]|uniref:hypothetical protein n=1 Tax=Thermococcus piezophilus TaxID=1712654 RepID=UPI001900BD7C|nr:hypothetical protein [Thermococcus piezophilus]
MEIGDAMYTITYYRYAYKVRPNQTSPVYEYILEKHVEKTKIHVYGQDMRLNKIDLGEHEVYAYETVVTPVKAVSMDSKLVITIWYVSNKSNAFLYPWDVSWFAMISPYTQNTEFVGMEFEYKGEKFLFMNPAPFQSGLLPYFEGNDELLGSLNEDLTNIYMGWVSVLHLAVWSAIAEENLMSPYQGTWSDMQGHTWRYSIKPDGVVSIGGFDFKTADVEWSYAGVPENVTLSGSGKVSPSLPIPILVEGSFSYKENNRWRTVYAYLELKELRLEKVKG